jgi:hypothetical protein
MTQDWQEMADKIAVFSWRDFEPIFRKHYLEDEIYQHRRDRFLDKLSPLAVLVPPGIQPEDVDWDAVEGLLAGAEAFGKNFVRHCEQGNQAALSELPRVWTP